MPQAQESTAVLRCGDGRPGGVQEVGGADAEPLVAAHCAQSSLRRPGRGPGPAAQVHLCSLVEESQGTPGGLTGTGVLRCSPHLSMGDSV